MSKRPEGFVNTDKWKPEDLNGKLLTWKVVDSGSTLPVFSGVFDARISAVPYEDGMIAKIIINAPTDSGKTEAEVFMAQHQIDNLQQTPTGFFLE